MATKILLKKSSTVGAIPLNTDLEIGEVALNLADRKLYTKDNSNNVVQVGHPYVSGTAPTSPAEGDLWYDSTNDVLKAYDGTAWQSAGYQNLSELEDVTITSIAAGEILKWNGASFVNNTLAEADIQAASTTVATVQAQDLDMGTNKVLFSNVYANSSALPSASSYHGMFAHTHDTGKAVFAHGGNWHNLLDESSSDTDDLSEGSNNLYYTDARAQAAISVTDAGGDGSLSYDNTTGVISYQGPVQADVLAHLSGGTGVSLSAGGEIALDFADAGFKTDNVVEGTTNLYYTDERVDDRVGALVVGGSNITATYDDAAGTLTIDQDNTGGLSLSNNDTDDLSEGTTNQYYLDSRARAAVSVTDAGGDGSLSYDNGTGVITYTGPSAAEVRAHHTGGTGVTITSGSIAIGQEVETTSDVTFNKVTTDLIEGGSTITIDPAGTGDATGDVIIAGSLTVQGTTTSVNSNEVNIGDSIILLNSDETGAASQNAGFEIERGTDANVSFIWNEADNKWDLGNEELQNVVIDGGSY